jgi:hypothetical protein
LNLARHSSIGVATPAGVFDVHRLVREPRAPALSPAARLRYLPRYDYAIVQQDAGNARTLPFQTSVTVACHTGLWFLKPVA